MSATRAASRALRRTPRPERLTSTWWRGRGLVALAMITLAPAATLSCRGGCATRSSGGGEPEADATPAAAAPSALRAPSTLVLPPAAVSAFQNPQHLPAYSGPTGSIDGTITVEGDPSPDVDEPFTKCPAAQAVYGKQFREGPPLANGARPLGDAMVGVTGYTGFYVPSTSEVRKLTIENCAFSERTVDMTIGEHLEISNKTKLIYAPLFAQVSTPALMVAPPGGDPVKLYPPKPAYYTLADRLQMTPYMVANVYVVAYPLHTVSALDGHYRIDGVPVGKLTVSARLAAIQKTAHKDVVVTENAVAHVDLTLTYRRPTGTAVPSDAGPALP